MATEVPMPKFGLTMEEAMIIDWLVADGDAVEADQPILLIETDKTETEVGSPGAGLIHRIGKPGDIFPCGELIGWLLADGETPPSATTATAPLAAPAAAAATSPATSSPAVGATSAAAHAPTASVAATTRDGRVLASPNAKRVASERGVLLASVRGTGPGGRIVSEDVEAAPDAGTTPTRSQSVGGQIDAVATFAARSLADLLGVDVAAVPVDPVERRVTRDSVALYVRTLLQSLAPTSAPVHAAAPSPTPPASSVLPLLQEPIERIRLTGMRGTIAKRMHASLQSMAQLTLTMDADMTAVLADRAQRKSGATPTPSITDYIVAASARALVLHPRMNAQVTENEIAVLPEVHVGLAVAVDNGLLVPVVRDTAHRDLSDLAAETSRIAAAARSGAISPGDLEGGTFSVSALGAFGVDMFTPVINPPNAGILGVGRLRDDVALVNGEVTTVKRLTLSLTWDHRVVDGVPAAAFCRTIVELLAEPSRLD
jgi:pyruvate dehydrogenase E2 component (dihydrolipoamide acetyltransferase)